MRLRQRLEIYFEFKGWALCFSGEAFLCYFGQSAARGRACGSFGLVRIAAVYVAT
jgi:hypothetical protein